MRHSYCYVIGNGIVIKVLQDGYLLPILGGTDVTLSFMVPEYAMCFYVLRLLLSRTWLYNLRSCQDNNVCINEQTVVF